MEDVVGWEEGLGGRCSRLGGRVGWKVEEDVRKGSLKGEVGWEK